MAEYPDKIRLILKNYPYKYRDYSHIAAEALLAAGDQGKYWEMHDIMIKNSPTLDRDSLIRYAGENPLCWRGRIGYNKVHKRFGRHETQKAH